MSTHTFNSDCLHLRRKHKKKTDMINEHTHPSLNAQPQYVQKRTIIQKLSHGVEVPHERKFLSTSMTLIRAKLQYALLYNNHLTYMLLF